jgi:mono/diheme cytochrome c family protein
LKRAYRVGALGAGLVAAALLVAGCGAGGVASSGARADTQNGATLFTANCGACHTLSAAGTTGTIGPNLDNAFAGDVKQGYPQSSIENVVLDQIRLGSGQVDATYTTSKDYLNKKCENDQAKCLGQPMPANIVKGQDAIDVAAYVASVAGQGGYTTGGGFASLGTDGAKIFKGAGCAGCHTLAAAGATGTTGPNLDQIQPPLTTAKVSQQVMTGGGLMPSFQGKLSPAQIQAVAQYVSSSVGK